MIQRAPMFALPVGQIANPSILDRSDQTPRRQARALSLVWLAACVCTALTALTSAHSARGDGGIVRASGRSGPYVVTVFTMPTPLRVGKADVSIMVQDGETGQVVAGADAAVRLERATTPGGTPSQHTGHAANMPHDSPLGPFPMTHAQATNKLLKAAVVEFPSPGPWMVEVDVKGPHRDARVRFAVDVRSAPPRWLDLLPWMVWPLVPIALFAFREAVVDSRRRRREERVLLKDLVAR
jgi:hypothetical protein